MKPSHSRAWHSFLIIIIAIFSCNAPATSLFFDKDRLELDSFTFTDNHKCEPKLEEWPVSIRDLTGSFEAIPMPNALRQIPGHIWQHPGDPSCIWIEMQSRETRSSAVVKLDLDGTILYFHEIPYGQAPLEMTSVLQLVFCGPMIMGVVGPDKVLFYNVLPDGLKFLSVQKETLLANTFIQSLVSLGVQPILFNKSPGFYDGNAVLYRSMEMTNGTIGFTARHTISTNDAKKLYGRFWSLSDQTTAELREELLYQLYRVQLASLPNDFLYFNPDNGLLLSSTKYTMLKQDVVRQQIENSDSPVPTYQGIVGPIRANPFSSEYWIARSLLTSTGKYRALKASLLGEEHENYPSIDVLTRNLEYSKTIRFILPKGVYSHFVIRDFVFANESTILAVVHSKKFDSNWETRLLRLSRSAD